MSETVKPYYRTVSATTPHQLDIEVNQRLETNNWQLYGHPYPLFGQVHQALIKK